MEKQLNSRKGIKNAMIYPIIALVVAVVVVAVMVTFVMPAFASLYNSLGAELPLMTRLLLQSGEFLQKSGVYILLVLGVVGGAGVIYIRTPKGRYKWDGLSLRFPLVGRINHLNELSKLSRSIAVLFSARLPLTEIMPLVIQSTSNKVVSGALSKIRDDMLGGEGLARPMSKHPVFMPMMVQMVKVGEETGNMDATLLSVAQSYEAEAEDRTKALIAMIQPVMRIIIGLIVGMMALSMVSAMYNMYSQLG